MLLVNKVETKHHLLRCGCQKRLNDKNNQTCGSDWYKTTRQNLENLSITILWGYFVCLCNSMWFAAWGLTQRWNLSQIHFYSAYISRFIKSVNAHLHAKIAGLKGHQRGQVPLQTDKQCTDMWQGTKSPTDYKVDYTRLASMFPTPHLVCSSTSRGVFVRKAADPDGVTGSIHQLLEVFTTIFNLLLLQSVVPSWLKPTTIILPPKWNELWSEVKSRDSSSLTPNQHQLANLSNLQMAPPD